MDRLTVKGRALVDEQGRERILNGLNMVFKGDHEKNGTEAFLPLGWDEELIQKLKGKGINVFRLGLIWEAVEPQPGVYNDEYLDFFSDFMDLCAKYEIYCYLDMHQDLYGSYGLSYGGDGAPKWAYLSGGKAPRKPKFVWAEGYFFPGACHTAFDNFWNNARIGGKGLQDYFCDMWAYIARRFKDKPNLLGFDVFNEPFPGSSGGKAFRTLIMGIAKTVLTNPNVNRKQLISQVLNKETRGDVINMLNDGEVYRSVIRNAAPIIKEFDIQYYYPFLRKVASSIRSVTDKGIIFMENCYYSNLGIPCRTPRLCYKDGTVEQNLVFSPHGYDLMVDTPAYNNASNDRVDHIFDEHERTQQRLDVPVLVGEWGGFYDDEGSNYSHLIHLLNKFDANLWSSTYWVYWKGLEDSRVMSILSRAYPVAVAGTLERFGTDYNKNEFSVSLTADAGKGTVELYAPKEPVCVEGAKAQITPYPNGGYRVLCDTVAGKNEIVLQFA